MWVRTRGSLVKRGSGHWLRKWCGCVLLIIFFFNEPWVRVLFITVTTNRAPGVGVELQAWVFGPIHWAWATCEAWAWPPLGVGVF